MKTHSLQYHVPSPSNPAQSLVLGLALVGALALAPAIAETKFSGLIELEASYVDDGSNTESDMRISSIEVHIDHELDEKLDGHVVFKYSDDDDDDIDVDSATINFHPNELTDLSAGRMVVPFGKFENLMVADPLTLELGETKTDALVLKRKFGNNLIGSAFVYRDDDTDDSISDGGMSLEYAAETFSAGISYISAADDKNEAGVSVYGKTQLGRIKLIGEYLQLDEMGNTGKKPGAATVQIGYELANKHQISASYQKSTDADNLVPVEESTDFEDLVVEKRMNIAYKMPVTDNSRFSAEYLRDTPYTGDDTDAVIMRFAYDF